MVSFLIVIALFMMMLPAALSILFASSHPLAVLWNFAWYALMGYLAALALNSVGGFAIGLLLAAAYVLRLLLIPVQIKRQPAWRPPNQDVFWNIPRQRQSAPRSAPGREPAARRGDDVVIDAEFRREPDAEA